MAEPVDLFILDEPARHLPAVLTDLSAGGMSLVVFAHVSGDTRLRIVLNIPGLPSLKLEGYVAWTEAKGDTTFLGLSFSHISPDDVKRINHMAEGYQDCELKLSFGLKDVCFRQCAYWSLCSKSIKLKH